LIKKKCINLSDRKGKKWEVIDNERKVVKLIFMNNDINRNTRTLIVSFVIAIMVLIPLRFVEVGNSLDNGASVLGETAVQSEAKIEAPYDQIDSSLPCNLDQEVDAEVSLLTAKLAEDLSADEAEIIFSEIENVEATRCK